VLGGCCCHLPGLHQFPKQASHSLLLPSCSKLFVALGHLLCRCRVRSRSNTANSNIKDSLPYPILPHITYLWLIAALEETRSRSALSSSRTRHTNQDKENALQVSPSCVFLLS
jgi:hypothetical protein